MRHRRTKGCGSREALLTMGFMLARQSERHWRRLNGAESITHVLEGRQFKDGILVTENAAWPKKDLTPCASHPQHSTISLVEMPFP